jgi:NADH-quinone oxidoreductase subunit H
MADLTMVLPLLVKWWATLPDWVPALVTGVLVFALVALMGQLAAVVMVLMERKVLSWLTQRKGPNRVGPMGALQTIADGVKLLFKEDIMVPGQDKFLFTLAPALFLFPVFALYALVPFSQHLLGVALPSGLLAVFALSSVSVMGVVLAGWASNNKYSLLGGMRSAAQAISYEIPLVLSLLGVVLFTGSLDLRTIIEAQKGGLFNWYSLLLTPLSFLIFYVSSIAEVNRVPFDLPEAESELVSGYNTEYSGMKFATFFLAEYAGLFILSALTAAVFFGGYYAPTGGLLTQQFGLDVSVANGLGVPKLAVLVREAEMLFWMLSKTYVFIYLAMLIRATLPRLKPDQLMGFSWKFLIPLSLINIFMLALGKLFTMQLASGWLGALPYLVMAIAVAIGGVGGYCVFMSRLFTQQLKARLR